MIVIPEVGMRYSARQHNVKLDALCDWIEANVLFEEESGFSQSEAVDVLLEEEVYGQRDFAWEMVEDAWRELQRRVNCIATDAAFSVSGQRIRGNGSWKDNPAHAFCLLLALAKWYRAWTKEFGTDYTEQGDLFEEMTKQSLQKQFSGWSFYRTGWSRTNTSNLISVVKEVASRLGESVGEVGRWTTGRAKDAGLDLLCYRPFPDARIGIPVFLMQCASGADWLDKLHTPDIQIWTKIVIFTAQPKRAFATPFALLDDAFRMNCNIVNGMLLDRYRLLAPGNGEPNWLSQPLRDRLLAWMGPRVADLPRYDE